MNVFAGIIVEIAIPWTANPPDGFRTSIVQKSNQINNKAGLVAILIFAANPSDLLFFFSPPLRTRGEYRIRTDDPLLAKQVL
ncbi:MAG TPA: hypothetical protein VFK94_00045, partial [Patescibacteria group bacterium]|nr:hypothetical protein [Patescibacteria group bacterium]